MTSQTRSLTLSAVFIASGILFPILFHMVSLGKAMLPMFWPIAIAAFLVPLPYAIIISLMTPVLSSILTGMPPLYPIMPVMMLELVTMVTVISFFNKKTTWGTIWVLAMGLLLSRLALMAGSPLVALFLGLPSQWVTWARLIESMPGIICMLIILPLFISRITTLSWIGKRNAR